MNLNKIYCAKCSRLVGIINVQQDFRRQVYHVSYVCHGVCDSIRIPRMALETDGVLIVNAEVRRCNTENIRL